MAKNVLKAFFSGLSPKEKKILYVAGGILVLALFDRLFYGPVSKESTSIDEEIEDQVRLIKKNFIMLQYENKILQEDDEHGIFYSEGELTHEELVAIFLREIESFAKGSKVALTNINPVNLEEKQGFVEYSMLVECAGNMKDIVDFLYKIDNSKKPIRVKSFEISPKKRDTYDVICSINIMKIIIVTEQKEPAA